MNDDELARIRKPKRSDSFSRPFNLLPRATSLHNVGAASYLVAGTPAGNAGWRKRKAALEQVDLTPRRYHKPNELSGGQRQRVKVARAR